MNFTFFVQDWISQFDKKTASRKASRRSCHCYRCKLVAESIVSLLKVSQCRLLTTNLRDVSPDVIKLRFVLCEGG